MTNTHWILLVLNIAFASLNAGLLAHGFATGGMVFLPAFTLAGTTLCALVVMTQLVADCINLGKREK